MSFTYWARLDRCWSPSYSTATLMSSSPCPNRPRPNPIHCAQRSVSAAVEIRRASTAGEARFPSATEHHRRPVRWWLWRPSCLDGPDSGRPVARRRPASTRSPGRARRPRRPRPPRVSPRQVKCRSGRVVTRMLATTAISSASMRSSQTSTPKALRRLVSMRVAGRAGSIHRAPCRAAAEKPARMPRRRDRSQHACARNAGVSSAPRGTYTSRCSATYRLRSSYGVNRRQPALHCPGTGPSWRKCAVTHRQPARVWGAARARWGTTRASVTSLRNPGSIFRSAVTLATGGAGRSR